MDDYYNETPEVVENGGGPPSPPQNDTLGIIGLISGILGVVCFCCYPLSIVLGVIAVVCGFLAKSKGQKFALAGIILGFAAIGLSLLIILLGVLGQQFIGSNPEEFRRMLEEMMENVESME